LTPNGASVRIEPMRSTNTDVVRLDIPAIAIIGIIDPRPRPGSAGR
jgi:hypothetical protein